METNKKPRKEDANQIPDFLNYPPSEDIYIQGKQTEIDPEDISRKKSFDKIGNANNEKDFKDDMTGGDLDIPGAELDDTQEELGSEDEENNYYSLGGDNHTDLEEDNG